MATRSRPARRRPFIIQRLAAVTALVLLTAVTAVSPASAGIGDDQCDVADPPPVCGPADIPEPTIPAGPQPSTPAPTSPGTTNPPAPLPPLTIPATAERSDGFYPGDRLPFAKIRDTNGALVPTSSAEVGKAPFSPVVQVIFNTSSSGSPVSYNCTGVLIGPDTVATAAHCVWDEHGYRRNGIVTGQNGPANGVPIVSSWAPWEYRSLTDSDGQSTAEESHWDYAAVTIEGVGTAGTGLDRGWMPMAMNEPFPQGGPVHLLSVWHACSSASGLPGVWFASSGGSGGYNLEMGHPAVKGCSGGPVVDRASGAVIGLVSSSDETSTTAHGIRSTSFQDLMRVRSGNPRIGPLSSLSGGTNCVPTPEDECNSGPIIVDPVEQ